MTIFTCTASHTHGVCLFTLVSFTSHQLNHALCWSPASLPIHLALDTAHLTAAASSLSMTPLLFYSSVLDVSRPAFPIPAGFPRPNCTNRPHSRECSHVLWLGYSLPVHLGKDCWDWGPHGFLSYGLTPVPSVTYSIWRSWAGQSQQLWLDSSSHYLAGTSPTTAQRSSYLRDLEKTTFFSYHRVFMFCRLAGYEIFLWWSRWLTLSSHLFMISWHLVLSFVFMVRCFSSLWVIRIQISFLKSPFIYLKTWLGSFFFNFLA